MTAAEHIGKLKQLAPGSSPAFREFARERGLHPQAAAELWGWFMRFDAWRENEELRRCIAVECGPAPEGS